MWIFVICLVSVVFFGGVLVAEIPVTDEDYPSCGYKGCPDYSQNKTNVHIICHTHDDVGWVKTADEYFFGGRRRQNYFAVEQILDSVVSELLKDKERRFVYVESAFLWRWWLLKDDIVKDAFKKLVDEGRLQLLGGGWVMSDEATPYYSALIDQMTVGHKFLKDTFGECNLPKVAWQLDPFGHSGEVAIEFAEMGFDGLIFSRMDKKEYDQRRANKSLEMIWIPDPREGSNGELFTGQTYDPLNPYHPPKGLCFDITCNDEPVIDNKMFHGYNVEERANDFVAVVQQYTTAYKTNNIILTMGGDFHYLVASSWFNNLDRLIKYINKNRTDMNVFYSTPACYLKAVHSTKTDWPVKKDEDFFPYGGTYSETWTGYFTSRPSFKYLVQKTNNFFQACKQMRVPLGSLFQNEQDEMARAMATVQHHDAVSGTEKQFVVEDYRTYLLDGITSCQKIVNATLSAWQEEKLVYNFCPSLNVTECYTTETNANFVITLYNPQAQYKNYTVNVPVNLDTYIVSDTQGDALQFDLLPLSNEVKAIPGRANYASHPHELVFNANDLPPLGIKSFLIERIPAEKATKIKGVVDVTYFKLGEAEQITVENGVLKLLFDGKTGLLSRIIRENEELKFTQNFFSYPAEYSGAYLFSTTGEAIAVTDAVASISVAKGVGVIEVRQVFKAFLSQIIRLYMNQDQIEFQWLVGPLPKAMQVITRYNTAIVTGSFYTDSNGRRLMKRQKKENIERSYYPITSAAVLKDDTHRVTILTDRAQGAASWQDGSIEIMIHRKLQRDDGKGVEEVLDEREFRGEGLVVRGTHIVQLSTSSDKKLGNQTLFPDGSKCHRIRSHDIAMAPIMVFSKAPDMNAETFKTQIKDSTKKSTIKVTLPENVHLLTFERWTNTSVLIRLEHIFEKGEHPELSAPTTIKLRELFNDYEVIGAVELSLAATIEKTKMKRLKWIRENKSQDEIKVEPLPDTLEITLEPMQIRTFEVTLKTPPKDGNVISSANKQKFSNYLFIILLNYIIVFINNLIKLV